MKILNFEVKEFANFLVTLELTGKNSRMRTRFCKLLADRMKQIEEDRNLLIHQYAEKDADGEPKVEIDEEANREVYKLVDRAGFDQEYYVLMNEEYIIDETEERKEMLSIVKDIVLNTDVSFKGDEAFIYDRWCSIVEGE